MCVYVPLFAVLWLLVVLVASVSVCFGVLCSVAAVWSPSKTSESPRQHATHTRARKSVADLNTHQTFHGKYKSVCRVWQCSESVSVCVCVCVRETGCTSRKQLQQVPLPLVELPPCLLTSQNHLKHTNFGMSMCLEAIMKSAFRSHLKPQLLFPLLHLLLLLLLFHSSPNRHTHTHMSS